MHRDGQNTRSTRTRESSYLPSSASAPVTAAQPPVKEQLHTDPKAAEASVKERSRTDP